MCLYRLIGNSKTMQMGLLGKRAIDRRVVQLDHLAAVIADEQLHRVCVIEVAAEDKCVQRFHLVGKALFEQKIECPVDGWRFGVGFRLLQLSQQIIGADGIAMCRQQAKYLTSGRGEADPSLYTESLGSL
ncbi:hypothetical protein FNBNMHLP_03403 [Aeromonas jandaei]